MTITLPKLNELVTPADFVNSYILTIVSAISFLIPEVAPMFFVAPTGAAPADEAQARAEAQFNDPNDDESFHNRHLQATIKALTGFNVRNFEPTGYISWRVGMVVTPAKPAYRDRTDDGYKMGVNYLVTNQTAGLARSIETAAGGLKETVKPMSQLNDEWTLVTDLTAIKELVTALSVLRGVKFVEDILIDSHNSGKALQSIVEKYLS